MSRTADLPGQALNIDLCLFPDSHLADIKLPAVSSSFGHLAIERLKEVGQEPDYPGKVFADPDLDYTEALQAFVQASQLLFGSRIEACAVEKASQRVEIQQLRQAEIQLRREQVDGLGKRPGSSSAAKKRLAKSLRNSNCMLVGVPAKRTQSIGKVCGNGIVNNRGSVNRKTNSGAWIE